MYQLPLDGILVVADAKQVRAQAQNKYVGDTVVRQFEQADLILLNKTDLVSAEELASLHAWMAEIAPKTPVIESVQSQVPMELLLGIHADPSVDPITSSPLSDHLPDRADYPHGFETWIVERSHPVNRKFLDRFAQGLGENIYRAKGFVWLQDDLQRRYIYQQVGTRWSLEPSTRWGDEPRQTQLVVIGCRGATSLEAIEVLLSAMVDLNVLK